MSKIGQLSRGLKWFKNNRDADGNLLKVLTEDVDKMIDVNLYLDYVKERDRDGVDLALLKVHLLQHTPGGRKSTLYKGLKDKLIAGDFKKEVKSKEKK